MDSGSPDFVLTLFIYWCQSQCMEVICCVCSCTCNYTWLWTMMTQRTSFLLKKLAPSNVNDLKNELTQDKRGKANHRDNVKASWEEDVWVRKSYSALGMALSSESPSLTIHSRTMVCLVQTTKSLKWILRTKSAAGFTNNTSGSCSAAHLCQSTAVGLHNIWSGPRCFF